MEIGFDKIVKRCVAGNEHESILSFYHERAFGGRFGPKCTSTKILDSGFY